METLGKLTQAQSDQLDRSARAAAYCALEHMVTVALTDDETSALIDLICKCGAGNFRKSATLTLLNQGKVHAAAEVLSRQDERGGAVMAGLLRRREAEEALFEKPDASAH